MNHLPFFEANRQAWNQKTLVHLNTEMYELEAFKQGKSSLREVDLEWVGNFVKGKKVLHLQCHFGMDSLSLERLGAEVTAVDLSNEAIFQAEKLRDELGLKTRFICCNVYDLPQHLVETFDLVFSTYGTIGWLPDLPRWSSIIEHYLKPGGRFYLAEFHPFIWTMTDDFSQFGHYNYFFEKEPIVEDQEGTYADRSAPIRTRLYSWNHHFGEILGCLINQGLILSRFEEFDYSPWACFPDLEAVGDQKFVFKKWGHKIPYFYALEMKKQ